MADREKGSRILGRVLPAAVQLWVRSQVDHIESLEVQLKGTDRQVLGGCIPGVFLSAQRAVYKGIHLDSAMVSAEGIQINLGQVLRGRALRLLEAFPVHGEVVVSEAGLNASLDAPYLSVGVESFWQSLTQQPGVAEELAQHYGAVETSSRPVATVARLLTDRLMLTRQNQQLQAGLDVVNGHQLYLKQPTWVTAAGCLPSQSLEGFFWDLGPETQIKTLTLQPGELRCAGQIEITP